MSYVDGIFDVTVIGRPAPQGSKRLGQYGQLLEQSPYLRAWAAAVKLAVLARYRELGVRPDELPLFLGPVKVHVTFYLDPADVDRIDGPPDIDKLLRATFDVLGPPAVRRPGESAASYARRNLGRGARVWEDDSRVVVVCTAKIMAQPDQPAGAIITVKPAMVAL